jgi:outer membrane protein assembly factor BamD (BamD/ComL family)
MKKFLLIFLLLMVVVFSTLPGTELMYDHGSQHPQEKISASLVYTAARIRMNVGSYQAAADWYRTAIRLFPYHDNADEAVYWLAFCLEKAKNYHEAEAAYNRFITTYPNHRFVKKAKNRLLSM